jgi:ribosomal protein S4E
MHATCEERFMKTDLHPKGLKDGAACKVVEGTHKGKSGVVKDIKTSKTGHVTITVLQADGERFKTLARNVAITK